MADKAQRAGEVITRALALHVAGKSDTVEPGKGHNQPAIAKMEEKYYELIDFNAFYERLLTYLGLKKHIRKAVEIQVVPLAYNPGGVPYTEKQLKQLEEFITKALHVTPSKIESVVVRTYLLGKIIAEAERKAKSREVLLAELPSTLAAAKTYKLRTDEINALKWAQTAAAENIRSISESARKIVVGNLVQATKERMPPKKLADELRAKTVDSESNLNRDWQRVAVTETGEIANNGFISSLPDGSHVIGWSFPNACDFCKKHIHGKVLRVTNKPPESYSHLDPKSSRYKELAKRWESEIWIGKNNIGRSRYPKKIQAGALIKREHHELALPAIIAHPWCRCRWFRFNPKNQWVDQSGSWHLRTEETEQEHKEWLAAHPHVVIAG